MSGIIDLDCRVVPHVLLFPDHISMPGPGTNDIFTQSCGLTNTYSANGKTRRDGNVSTIRNDGGGIYVSVREVYTSIGETRQSVTANVLRLVELPNTFVRMSETPTAVHVRKETI